MNIVKIYSIILFTFLFKLYSPASTAQEVNFTSFNAEHGLSDNSVLAIIQDKKGFLWVGTSNGLNRYDGRFFKPYSLKKDLPSNYILSLLVDRSGNLWVGSSSGLFLYDEKLDSFKQIESLGKNSPRKIHCLSESSGGEILLGTEVGLHRIKDSKIEKITLSSDLDKTEIKTIYEDKNGSLWLGYRYGLASILLKNKEKKPTYYSFKPPLKNVLVTSVIEDHSGILHIGTHHNGMFEINTETKQLSRLNSVPEDEHVRSFFLDKNGDIWIGTLNGILIYTPSTRKEKRYIHSSSNPKSLSQNSVYCIYQDKDNNIWIGTYFGGLNQYNTYKTPFSSLKDIFKTPESLNSFVVSGMVVDSPEYLWIGTEDAGLFKINRTTGQTENFKTNADNNRTISSNNVKTVFRDSDGNIWIGTHGGGLNVYNSKDGITRIILDKQGLITEAVEVYTIQEDKNKILWVGTNVGLLLFKREGRELHSVLQDISKPFDWSKISAIFKDKKDRIWIASTVGVYLYRNSSLEKVSDFNANDISETSSGTVWVSVINKGFAKYEESSKELTLQIPHQKNYNRTVKSLVAGNSPESLWAGTDKGLIQLNTKDYSMRFFLKSDGLPIENFNIKSVLKLENGTLLFGGLKGVSVFNPSDIDYNKSTPPLYFTSFKLFEDLVEVGDNTKILSKNISDTDHIALSHNQNVFTIYFALTNYIRSHKNRYQYILEGYNQDWINTGSPFATFTNVPPGTYKLLVRGANNDGIWSQPISMTIKISPSFWKSWLAYFAYIIIIATLIFFITRFFYLKEVVKKENALYQNKINFFTNISHEIRTHLTLLTLPLEQLIEESKQPISENLKLIRNNTGRLQNLVEELLEFRQAETGNLKLKIGEGSLKKLLGNIVLSFENAAKAKQMKIHFLHDNKPYNVYIDNYQVSKVFTNLIGNAIKFGHEKTDISVTIEETAQEVLVKVTDIGVGIEDKHIEKIFSNFFHINSFEKQNTGYGIGLALSKSIVDLHDGKITAKSYNEGENKKTEFKVTFKKGTSHLGEFINTHVTYNSVLTQDQPQKEQGAVKHEKKHLQSVLIVDDNRDIRQLIKSSLVGKYHIFEAENGLDGLDFAQNNIPDIIVSDVMMPEMDGHSLCKKLKTDKRTSHIPVILLTALNTQKNYMTSLENEANLYITKPFSLKVLQLSIRNLLNSNETLRQHIFRSLNGTIIDPLEESEIDSGLQDIDKSFINELISIVNKNMYKEDFGVTMLSKEVGMSAPILYKKLSALTGQTVNGFIKTQKMNKAATLLSTKKMSIQEVADAIGFKDAKYFVKEFKKHFGSDTANQYL